MITEWETIKKLQTIGLMQQERTERGIVKCAKEVSFTYNWKKRTELQLEAISSIEQVEE